MKKKLCLAAALMMLLSMCACANTHSDKAVTEEAPAYMMAESYAAADTYAGSGLASFDGAKFKTNGSAEIFSEPSPQEAQTGADKIIYTSDATVETTDFDAALERLLGLVEEYRGYVESSSINGSNFNDISRGKKSLRSANYTLRIPSENFDTLMQGLSSIGNVPYSHIYTDNVTAQYYDTQARLDAYKVQEQSLLRLMEKAETVEDIITVESKLSELRYNIESLQSSLNSWDRRVSYSSVYVTVNEVEEYTPPVTVNRSFAQRIASAFSEGISGAVKFLGDALVWLVRALPAIVFAALVILVLSFPIKKLRAKRKAKKAAAAEKEEDQRN